MNAKGFLGLALLAMLAIIAAGCAHGSGLELGAFGSSLDSDDLGDGYGGGAKLEWNPIDLVSVDARASWIHFDDTEINMFPLELAGLVNLALLGERIVPYVGAGVGYYLFDESDLDNEVGFFPLVGLEIGLQRISLLVEARWLLLEADVDSAKDELADLTEADIDGFGVNLGLLIRL
jgi:opacity protein-like surface antigen